MSRFAKKMVPVLSVAVLGMGSLAFAGQQTETVYCYKNTTDGAGTCYGNFLAFRNHAGASTRAYFYKHDSGTKSFYAAVTNTSTNVTTSYSCTPDAAAGAMWSKAISHSGYFYVSWDANGTCTYVALTNGSHYANF
jgi:hypothetical protein